MGAMKHKKSNKKKSKSKSTRKDEWTHEGGVGGYDNNDDKPKTVGRRKTQEYDEKMRRGRRKMFENNKKFKVIHKLSKKVSFLDKDEKLLLQSNTDKVVPIKRVKRLDLDMPNDSTTITKSLQKMLKKEKKGKSILNLLMKDDDSSKTVNKPINSENNTNSSLQHNTLSPSNNTTSTNANSNKTSSQPISTVISVVDTPADEGDDDANTPAYTADGEGEGDEMTDKDEEHEVELMMNGKYKYPHQYFFSSLTTLTPQQQEEFNTQNKIRYIADTLPYYTNEQSSDLPPERALDARIYGQIAHPQFITPIATLADIPQLPKLFRSRMHSTTLLNTTDRILLPYLCSYTDMFIEHPLETEKLLVDDTVPSIGGDVMGSVMWHIVTHTMRTRYVSI